MTRCSGQATCCDIVPIWIYKPPCIMLLYPNQTQRPSRIWARQTSVVVKKSFIKSNELSVLFKFSWHTERLDSCSKPRESAFISNHSPHCELPASSARSQGAPGSFPRALKRTNLRQEALKPGCPQFMTECLGSWQCAQCFMCIMGRTDIAWLPPA